MMSLKILGSIVSSGGICGSRIPVELPRRLSLSENLLSLSGVKFMAREIILNFVTD